MLWLIFWTLFTIIFAIIFAILRTLYVRKEYNDYSPSYISRLIVGFIIGIVCSLTIAFILSASLPTHEVNLGYTSILALNNQSSIEGQFFLGSGSINGTTRYYYLAKYDDGINLDSIPTDNAYLNEDSTNPRIEWYGKRIASKFWSQIVFDMNPWYFKAKIYIPPHSIKYNFNVDLQQGGST